MVKNKKNLTLIEQFKNHSDFTKILFDSFVLITKEKKIVKFNPQFCKLVESRATDIREIESLDKILSMRLADQKKDLFLSLFNEKQPTKYDSVIAKNKNNGHTLNLSISSYPYFDQNQKVIGLCLLIKDITSEQHLRSQYRKKSIESITDSLTHLYTRKFFELQMDRELSRCKRHNINPHFCVMMVDLDMFKSVNDTYGHQAGDHVIQETAKILKKNCRKTDILARYGGEEILVMLFDSDKKNAFLIAEKLRQAIASHVYLYEKNKISITASIGMTMVTQSYDKTQLILKRVDSCLYHAKNKGRNMVVIDDDGKKKWEL